MDWTWITGSTWGFATAALIFGGLTPLVFGCIAIWFVTALAISAIMERS